MRVLIHLVLPLVLTACVASGAKSPGLQSIPGSPVGQPQSGAGLKQVAVPDHADMGFAELAALLRQHHPRLHEAEAAVQAALGRVRQAALYPNPVAEIELEEYDIGESGMEGAESTLRVKQPILWGSQRRHAIAAARAEVEVRRRERDRLELELMGQLRQVYDDLLYLKQAHALNDELTSFTRQSLKIAQTRFELQASPQSDVSRAEVELFEREMNRRELQRDLAQATTRLAALLGGAQIRIAQVRGDHLPTLHALSSDTLKTWILAEHPSLQAARAEAEAARSRLAREKSERLPDLSIMAGYGHDRAQSNNNAQAAIGIEIPIFNRNQGEILAVESEIEAAENRAAALEDHLLAELGLAWAELDAARQRQAYHRRQVLPSARRAYEQVYEGYRVGKLAFLELIDAQRTLTAARLQQLELMREIRRAETRLFALAGPDFTPFELNPSFPASEGAIR